MNKLPKSFEGSFFFLDQIPLIFPGVFDPGKDWNGFSCPLFKEEVAHKMTFSLLILERVNSAFKESLLKYKNDSFYDIDDLECTNPYQTEFGALYPIGSGGWAWSSLDPARFIFQDFDHNVIRSFEDAYFFFETLKFASKTYHIDDEPSQQMDLRTQKPLFTLKQSLVIKKRIDEIFDLNWSDSSTFFSDPHSMANFCWEIH